MTTSLYDLSVGSYLQSLTGVADVLEKGRVSAADRGLAADDFLPHRLADDMLPFSFQVHAVRHQSFGTIEAMAGGVFGPPKDLPALDYAGLQAMIDETIDALNALDPDSVNQHAGKPMLFKMQSLEIPFTMENFVLSFSLPNLYFHATTAYDILRIAGVPLTKKDFLGALRVG